MMAFHHSSESISLRDGGYLHATCKNTRGQSQLSTLNLDNHLGNNNGAFEWGGVNFSKSARDATVVVHGASAFLHAKLRTKYGQWKDARVDISDHIANLNGSLRYVGGTEPVTERNQSEALEDTDFLSSTLSDLKELAQELKESFMGGPSHTSTDSSRDQVNNWSVPRRSTYIPESDDSESPFIRLEDSGSSTQTSTTELRREEPRPHEIHEAPPFPAGAASSIIPTSPMEREAQEHEQMIFQAIKDHLMKGNGHTVQSLTNREGQRVFELRGNGNTRVLTMEDLTLFDQDDYRQPSVSSGTEYDRCITPSVVDGEDDFEVLSR
jgi:hypothetical protein